MVGEAGYMNWSLPVSRGVGFSVVTTSAFEDVGGGRGGGTLSYCASRGFAVSSGPGRD